MSHKLTPQDFGLEANSNGELLINKIKLVELAKQFGTPLYVLNEKRLKKNAAEFKDSAEKNYPGKATIHYPFKCNSVSAIVHLLKSVGLSAEVMTEFEFELAIKLGFKPNEIIVNGPCKDDKFLIQCIDLKVKALIIDSLDELQSLIEILNSQNKSAKILFRVNPNYTPKGMNQGAATGSRKRSHFGLDLIGGEVTKALKMIKHFQKIDFLGYHMHIGTGINYPSDYSNALQKLKPLIDFTFKEGFKIKIMNVGGGFASATTRELTSKEMLLYQAVSHFPKDLGKGKSNSYNDFIKVISKTIKQLFKEYDLPELIYEPGRCLTSPNQLLLLKINRIKERKGVGKWILTDGGLGTITLPTFYEYHEVFLCNEVNRKPSEHVTITGPCCFAADIVYKNKFLPKLNKGEVVALMDTGAYFNAMESNFDFPRPAILSVNDKEVQIVRQRENFEMMIRRDIEFVKTIEEKIK